MEAWEICKRLRVPETSVGKVANAEKCDMRHCLAFEGCMNREDGAVGRLSSSGGAVRRRLFHGKIFILGRNWVSLYVFQK